MGGNITPDQTKPPCTILPFKQHLWMYLATKTSGCLWHLVDNFSCKLDRFAKYYETTIGTEYLKEYTNLHLPKKSKVLHIGCGAYPLTDIMLAQQPNITKIVGIDNDPRAVHFAQTIIEQKHLQKRIKIEQGNGQNYPIHTFNMIIISSCSWPKLEIIHHVITTSQKNSLIIIRELNNIISPILTCIHTHSEITINKHITHNPFPFKGPVGWQSYYLIKT